MATNAKSKYVTDLVNASAGWVNKAVSSGFGAAVTGERMHVGLLHKTRGTGSRLHYHRNEQFNFVLRGTLMGEIGGEPFRCPRGHVLHIPANTPHSCIADPDDEDVIFYAAKDTSAGVAEVTTVDGKLTGPRIEPGLQLDDDADRGLDFGS